MIAKLADKDNVIVEQEDTMCRNYKHGYTYHPLYRVWADMKSRCLNPNTSDYPRYGGRGIVICAEWITDAAAFVEWGINNGWAKGLLIDRIDVNGDYTPNNCRFLTIQESNKNRRGKSGHRKKSFLPQGVNKQGNRFIARRKIKGKTRYLGSFLTASEAHQAFLAAGENNE